MRISYVREKTGGIKMNNIYNYCFPGGKFKALIMSYDDGLIEDRRLVALFNQYGIRGTFHLNSGLFGSISPKRIDLREVSDLYKGHEISCHTYHHHVFARCPLPETIEEIIQDRITLEQCAHYPVRGLSYPCGSFSDEIIKILPSCGIEYSRVVDSTHSFALPQNYLRWEPTCHHNDNQLFNLAEQFIHLEKHQYLNLMMVWGHSYEFEKQNNWNRIEKFCEYMGERDDVWYCSCIDLVDCISNSARLQFSADNHFVHNPNANDCWIRVNDEPICIPGGKTVYL